ncbi:MAG TPA: adenylate/guanylate cyclase domain-containing protein, partial [Polyangiaceae bacterium]
MRRAGRWTLTQFFFAVTTGMTLVAGALLFAFLAASRRSTLESAERLRAAGARRIEARVQEALNEASGTLEAIERDTQRGAMDTDDPGLIEARLFSAVQNAPHLADVTFTHAQPEEGPSFDSAGNRRLAQEGRWQVSVWRATPDPEAALVSRKVVREGEAFVGALRTRKPGGSLLSVPFVRAGAAADPTTHPTFEGTASEPVRGSATWTELAWFEPDVPLPPAQRRVVVSVQKALTDGAGRFLGVLRVGLLSTTIDAVTRLKVDDGDPNDPHRVFLAYATGELVTRLSPDDPIVVVHDALRVVPAHPPPAIAAALASPALRSITPEHTEASTPLDVNGERWLASFYRLPDAQDWVAGIVVPEAHYTRELARQRNAFLALLLAFALAALVCGGFVLKQTRAAFARLSSATERMRRFEFAAAADDAPFHDVAEVMDGLERAKTALRALSKYVPMDLVQELYAANREPALGGEPRDLSLLFTDIRGFTTIAEGIAPEVLAPALGLYLDAMTSGIVATSGTIDKFLGDGVMAFWNAPALLPDHATRACEAVLRCQEATAALFASPEWKDLPPLVTRFGLHTDRVLVGHFGAPARLSYTAMGDGVNLA